MLLAFRRTGLVIFLLLWACLLFPVLGHAQPESASCFDAFYAYDAALPLDAEVQVVRETPEVREEHVVFSSTHDERVPALLFLPVKAQGPSPCVLALHGLGGDKESLRLLGALLCPLGIAVLAYDAQYHGERRQPAPILSPFLYRSRDALIQTVVDGRRAIDYLCTRPEIDHQRIGLVGLSMGGILGGVLAGVEPRLKVAALLVAGGGWGDILRLSDHPVAKALRESGLDPQGVQQALDPVDPSHFVSRIPARPLLFINGRNDEIVPPATSEALQSLAAAPTTEVQWLEAGHGLNATALPLLIGWLGRNL